MSEPIFPRLALIGIGLIGSSIALAARQGGLAGHVAINSRTRATLERAARAEPRRLLPCRPGRRRARRRLRHPLHSGRRLGRGRDGDRAGAEARRHRLRRRLGQGRRSSRRCSRILPKGVHFVPAHPVAGTEYSGPDAGFAELFQNRWCILTPPPGTDPDGRRAADGVLARARRQCRDDDARSITIWCSPSPATCRISSPTTSSAPPPTSRR